MTRPQCAIHPIRWHPAMVWFYGGSVGAVARWRPNCVFGDDSLECIRFVRRIFSRVHIDGGFRQRRQRPNFSQSTLQRSCEQRPTQGERVRWVAENVGFGVNEASLSSVKAQGHVGPSSADEKPALKLGLWHIFF